MELNKNEVVEKMKYILHLIDELTEQVKIAQYEVKQLEISEAMHSKTLEYEQKPIVNDLIFRIVFLLTELSREHLDSEANDILVALLDLFNSWILSFPRFKKLPYTEQMKIQFKSTLTAVENKSTLKMQLIRCRNNVYEIKD